MTVNQDDKFRLQGIERVLVILFCLGFGMIALAAWLDPGRYPGQYPVEGHSDEPLSVAESVKG
jgi:hypothetical protein